MKREIPLFVIDTKKCHKKGECDFIVCTDQDNGFVAKVEYVSATEPEYGDDYRVDCPRNGLSLKTTIKRVFGNNPKATEVKSLLKKGVEYYIESVTLSVDVTKVTTAECIEFVEKLSAGNKHYLEEAGVDFDERRIIQMSLDMLDAIKNKLFKLKLEEER